MEQGYRIDYDGLKMVEIAQFIRDHYPRWAVARDWYIFWKPDGTVSHWSATVWKDNELKYRHPDIMVFFRKHILFVMEIDGSIHDKKVQDTVFRDTEYFEAGVPLEVINEAETKDIYAEIRKRCDRWELLTCT